MDFYLARDEARRASARATSCLAFLTWWIDLCARHTRREAKLARVQGVAERAAQQARAAMAVKRQAGKERLRLELVARGKAVSAVVRTAEEVAARARDVYGEWVRRKTKQGGEAVDLALARCEHVRDEVEKRQRTEWHAPGWAAAWTATWAASNIAGTHPMTLYGSEV